MAQGKGTEKLDSNGFTREENFTKSSNCAKVHITNLKINSIIIKRLSNISCHPTNNVASILLQTYIFVSLFSLWNR